MKRIEPLRIQFARQLHEAVRQTFPASGKTPALRPALWAPNLTNP